MMRPRVRVVVAWSLMWSLLGGTLGCEARVPEARQGANAASESSSAAAAVCDVWAEEDDAPELRWPELDTSASISSSEGWTWVSVWATWCAPCVEEIPRLVRWRDEWEPLGSVVLLSVDESREQIQAFRDENAAIPESLRVSDVASFPRWLGAMGLAAMGSLPIQLLVDRDRRVRCIIEGTVDEEDFEQMKAILR